MTDVKDVSDPSSKRAGGLAAEGQECNGAAPEGQTRPAGTSEGAAASDELRSLQAERDRLYEGCLRVTADFDNYRKRVERDRQEHRDYALESILRQLLPVLDNFERALDVLPPGLPKAFVDGMTLIHKQLRDVLLKQGLSSMDATGQIFDPHVHEAVETEVRTDIPHHQVLSEVVKGYKMGKRVLRPAMVKVSVKPEEGRSETDSVSPQEDPA